MRMGNRSRIVIGRELLIWLTSTLNSQRRRVNIRLLPAQMRVQQGREFGMKKRLLTRLAKSKLLMALVALLFGSLSAFGQQSNPPTPSTAATRAAIPVGPTDPRWRRPPPNESDVRLRSLSSVFDSATEEERVPLMMEIIRDFERMQIIREQQLVTLSTASVPDYKRLSRAASEITNRANHIRFNVPFPLSKGDNSKGTVGRNNSHEDLALMLTDLNAVIKSFLDSPVFRMASPDDKELRAAAGRDLERIIRLSELVNKLAKRMSKAAHPAG